MTDRFAVVLCPSCRTSSWIVEDIHRTDRTECPSCATSHQTKRLKVYYSSDAEEDAREARSQLLGRRSSADFDVEEHSYYACEENAEGLYDKLNERYEEYVDASMEAHREKFADGADGVFSEWNDLYASLYEGAFEDCDRRYEALVDEQLRQFEAGETVDGAGSITYTNQVPLSAVAELDVGDRSPTDLWTDLSGTWSFIETIIEAIRVSATGKRPNDFREELADLDLPQTYPELAVRIGKGDPDAVWHLVDDLRTLGQGASPTEEIPRALSLLAGSGRTPTVAVRIGSEFFNRRNDQRQDVCEILTALARACDVRVVSSGIVRRELATKHREDLPGVSEACNTPRRRPSVSDTVEEAWNSLDYDSKEVQLLRRLSEEGSETLSLHAIRSEVEVGRARVSQWTTKLTNLNLVGKFDTSDGRHVELLEAGSELLSRLDAEIGQQAELDSCVSDSGKSSIYCRVSPDRDGGGEETPTTAATGPADRRCHGTAVNVEYMPRWRGAAVAATATDGAISLVNHPVEPSDELRQPYLSHDDGRLVVGAEYANPMQYAVCVARALTDRRVFGQVLTPDRVDGDRGSLGGLATDDPRILRDARCLGWLSDRSTNAEDYAAALMDAEDELLDMTRRWHTGDYSCTDGEFRSQITRFAHGMIGTVAHLCDLADVDLVREVRVPEFTRRFDVEDRKALAKTLVHSSKIASRHGHFAAYRQLFEDDPEKRAAAMEPVIPADNPSGDMIGSYVVVGANISNLEDDLRAEIRGTTDGDTDRRVHEDAPEFDVPVSLKSGAGRSEMALAVRDRLTQKNLSATREAIALFDGLVGSPLDAAVAIDYSLQTEDVPRDIRLDEVRTALASLPADRLFPTMQPTVQKLTKALLTVESPLTQSELADRAGVSTRSVRTHLPRLEALGLAEVSEAGIRFALPFASGDERGKDIVPGLTTRTGPEPVDVLYELGEAISGEAVHDGDTPVGAAFFKDDWMAALRAFPVYERWIDAAVRLSHHGTEADRRTVRFGKQPQQAAITEVAA